MKFGFIRSTLVAIEMVVESGMAEKLSTVQRQERLVG